MAKFSSAWKLLKLTGDRFWVERNASGRKNSFFKKVKHISRGKYLNLMIKYCFLFERESFCDISPKIEKIPNSDFASGMVLRLLLMQNFFFKLIDGKFDFWDAGL